MLYFMWSGRLAASKVGLLHICTFILLLLSGDRNFAVTLNRPFTEKLPTDLPLFQGSHVDLLFIVLHKLVVNGNEKLGTLYNCFLTIIANVSPYTKTLSMVASVKLMNLLEMFSSPRFLFAGPDNFQFCMQLVDAFSNMVQYQYEGNTHLVYSLVRRRHVVEALVALRAPVRRDDLGETQAMSYLPSLASPGSLDSGVESDDDDAYKRRQVIRPGQVGSPGTETDATEATDATDASASEEEGEEEEEEEGEEEEDEGDDDDDVEQEYKGAPSGGRGVRSPSTDEEMHGRVRAAAMQPQHGNERGAPAGAPAAFRPTQEWLDSWKGQLKLGTLLRLVNFLGPQVDEFMTAHAHSVDEDAVVRFLKDTTMVGLLPVPHPIVTRRYQPNQYTSLWFTTFLWGVVFLRSQELPVFDADRVKLFSVTIVG